MAIKILLLNYYWPPCGGSAVQRWLDITNNLVAHDIHTYVVTVDEKQATYPYTDETLLSRIDASTHTYRTATAGLFGVYKKYIGKGKVPAIGLVDEPDPTFLQKMARFARGNFFLPDPRKGWNRFAYACASELLEKEQIDIVFTAGPPHSTHLAGLKLKKEFPHIKWIADIHDYWTEISYLSKFYRTRFASWLDKRLERKVLFTADRIMTHCQSSVRLQCKKLKGAHCDKIFVHTMGFNEDLFVPGTEKAQTHFTIIYTGIIAEHYEPGILFRALKTVMGVYPDVPVRLQFVGALSPAIKEQALRLGLGDVLEEIPYVPHRQVVALLYQATALFLINPKFENESMHVPGKLYEYLAVFKPVISISPHGSENEQIIRQMKAGRNFDRSEEEALAAYLTALMQQWRERGDVDLPDNPDVRVYGRRHEAGRLAEVIRSLQAD